MKINFKKTIIYLGAWSLVLSPLVVSAQSGGFLGNLVPCGHEGPDCKVEDFIVLISNVIKALIYLGIAFSSIVFAYAGFLYITARGSEEQVKKATKIFTRVGVGLLFALISFLIIELIVNVLGVGEGENKNIPNIF